MPLELSKTQNKIARELIQKSLQIEYAPHKAYLCLYKETTSFDKHIARRYDDLRGSRYFMTLVALLTTLNKHLIRETPIKQ